MKIDSVIGHVISHSNNHHQWTDVASSQKREGVKLINSFRVRNICLMILFELNNIIIVYSMTSFVMDLKRSTCLDDILSQWFFFSYFPKKLIHLSYSSRLVFVIWEINESKYPITINISFLLDTDLVQSPTDQCHWQNIHQINSYEYYDVRKTKDKYYFCISYYSRSNIRFIRRIFKIN